MTRDQAHHERLAQRLFGRADIGDDEACWIWQGSEDGRGYGQIGVAAGDIRGAHRVAYELVHGEIPGLDTDHLCRTPLCINPSHMEPVTRKENTMRGFGASAMNARKATCKNGHQFTEANTYHGRLGRACRKCHAEHERRRRAKGRPTNPRRD